MTSLRSPVVLIGPMGAGKTSIGRRVAKNLGVTFTDTDIDVARANGPIETIFAAHGEPHFRELERAAAAAALAGDGIVSLGGGAPLHPATRADLASHRVLLLTVEPAIVAGRIRDTKRPLLQSDDALTRWSELYAERRPIYEELATATFDTSIGPLQSVVEAIAQWVREDEENR